MIKKDAAKSHVRVAVSKALAEALICGIDEAAQSGRPLSQLQQTDLATMHIMAYSHAVDVCENIELEVHLLDAQRTLERGRRLLKEGPSHG